MKKIMAELYFIVVLNLLFLIGAVGQVKDSISLSQNIPIKSGFIIVPSPLQHYYSESNGFYIYNHLESDSVFSITAGTVINVLKFDEDIFCLVHSGRRTISYGPFKFCPLIIGNHVKRGYYIGAMNDDDYEDGKYYLLILMKKGKKYVSFKKYVSWINKQ
ncbi:MAG: hypothetical protein J0I84_14445 [Terrimonas sp.]|nr:hypothetical protein [Terrimonas sp.]OJY85342.1 MAG: hypothetical protein BGP13_22880 [Sphingobacteriales bacterium 40-81]